jgi:hypothetical protein
MKYFNYLLLLLGIVFSIKILYDFRNIQINLTPDSFEYINFAKQIQNKDLISPYQKEIVRTPMYPVLLSFFDLSDYNNLKKLHLFIFFVTILIVPILLLEKFNFSVLFFSTSFVLCLVNEFALSILTEWISICFLILLVSLFFIYLKNKTVVILLNLCTVTVILALLRPVLLFLVFIPFIYNLITKARIKILFLSFFTPIFLILPFYLNNYYKYNYFTLSPFSGVSLFGVSSVIDPSLGNDNINIKDDIFLNYLRSKIKVSTPIDSQLKLESNYNFNVWMSAEEFRKEFNLNYFEWNKIAFNSSLIVINSNPIKYLTHIVSQFKHQVFYLPLYWWLVIIFNLFYKKNFSTYKLLYNFCLFSIVIHLVHLFICSMTNVIFYRLFILTVIPVIFTSLVSLLSKLENNLISNNS